MNDIQLNEKLLDLRKELMSINTQISTGTTPENPGRVREVKKTIARILTVFNLRKNKKVEVKEEKKVEVKEDKKEEKKEEKKDDKKISKINKEEKKNQ